MSKVAAIFGAGRIGKVHFHNCFLNERIEIRYVVEEIPEVANDLVRRYQLDNQVKVLSLKDVDEVYNDKR